MIRLVPFSYFRLELLGFRTLFYAVVKTLKSYVLDTSCIKSDIIFIALELYSVVRYSAIFIHILFMHLYVNKYSTYVIFMDSSALPFSIKFFVMNVFKHSYYSIIVET